MSMSRCSRCEGFVPPAATSCPNCRSGPRAWWAAPLAFAGAGLASVTLSACYGPACVTQVTLPDGSETSVGSYESSCPESYDCRDALAEGRDVSQDPQWQDLCTDPYATEDAGSDAGTDAGTTDGGLPDGGG